MSRDFRLYLDDIVASARKALAYTHGLTLDQFLDGDLTRDAVVLNLQIIGEAAGHVPDDVRASHPEVEWRRIIGLRNVIAHGYFALNQETIWDIVENHLPALLIQVERILAEDSEA